MPRITIKMKEKDGTEIECNASGWFCLFLSFSNEPKNRLKKFVKEHIFINRKLQPNIKKVIKEYYGDEKNE